MGKGGKDKKNSTNNGKDVKYGFRKSIHEVLAEKHACYVLITCDPPKENGTMNVAMTYEGDPMLAAYLLQGAQAYIDEYQDEDTSFTEDSHFID